MSQLNRRLIATQGIGGSPMLRARQGLWVARSPAPSGNGGRLVGLNFTFPKPERKRDRKCHDDILFIKP